MHRSCCNSLGAVATVLPAGTSSVVEADFSIVNWHKDPDAKAMMNFSLDKSTLPALLIAHLVGCYINPACSGTNRTLFWVHLIGHINCRV
jgi:hypothetical protein